MSVFVCVCVCACVCTGLYLQSLVAAQHVEGAAAEVESIVELLSVLIVRTLYMNCFTSKMYLIDSQ